VHAVAHCRPGFETECLQDLALAAERARIELVREPEVPALAAAQLEHFDATRWSRALRDQPPIFARSVFTGPGRIQFPGGDRVGPIVEAAHKLHPPFSAVWLEMPDSNEGKTLSGLCRRLQPLIEAALKSAEMLDASSRELPRLHVLFLSRAEAYVGTSDHRNGSAWPMGIPRLRMPPGAPSRSTLKLAEAFKTFLGESEADLVRPGMRVVDLGAAPGGWTWQLAYRGLRVTAVDNAALKGDVAHDSLVTHVRDDGYAFRPRRPADWMVCDIVDKPSRIAALVGRWIAQGDARRSIFNLKLPMKKRYDEVRRCADNIADAIARADMRHVMTIKQLYHDREEVTGYVARVD